MPVTSGTVAVRLTVKVPLIVFLNPPPARVSCWPSMPALPSPAVNPVTAGCGLLGAYPPLPVSKKLNMFDPIEGPYAGPNTRLGLAIVVLWHAADHYGQMTLYLRENSIVPPSSRANSPPLSDKY